MLSWSHLLVAAAHILCSAPSNSMRLELREYERPSSIQSLPSLSADHADPWHALHSEVDPPSSGVDRMRRIPQLSWDSSAGDGVVVRLVLSTPEEAQVLIKAADDSLLDILEFKQDWAHVYIRRAHASSFHKIIPSSLWTSMKVVANGNPSLRPAFVSPAQASLAPYAPELFFSEYQRLSTIHIWMNEVAKPHAGHAELISVGSSYEGREILGLKLSGHWRDQGSAKRETILITGGAHGREWISVSSVNYLALQFISSYGKDTMRTRMADAFDWVFVPVLNPDGYEYSWTTDRFWRKTRQPTHYALCDGFDLDKAYGYQFDFSTSTHPCSNSFPGQMPWQATEAAQMKEWVMNQTDLQFVAYIDLHSYSQQVLYPYAYSCDSYPPSWENLEELAWGLARAMRLSSKGANYDIGRACEGNVVLDESGKEKRLPRLERGGGSSLDWFYHEARVRYAYQIKLPDTGSYGFLLPKEYIVSTGMSVARAMDFLGRFLLGEIGAANAIQRASHAAPHIPNAAALQTATVLTASTWVETGLSRVKHVCARPFYGIRDWAMRNMRA